MLVKNNDIYLKKVLIDVVMGPLGFEPRTSRLSAVRSNQAEPRAPYLIHVYLIFKIAFIVV